MAFQQCSYDLADVVTGILNCSITGTLPSQWLSAVISLVPKVSAPKVLSDYRPISVTPIMSWIAEKRIVTRWIRPSIPVSIFQDQFAFKLTGSTTCALSHFMHHTDDGLSRRHDGSLVTDDEDEFGGVSRDYSEKHKCGHT